jgi:hypothetical protein
VTLDTTFKQFVEEAKGVRLADIESGTARYRKLVKEFNQLKQAFLDNEAEDMRPRARMLPAEEGLEAIILAGIAYSWVLGAIGSM